MRIMKLQFYKQTPVAQLPATLKMRHRLLMSKYVALKLIPIK